MSAKTVFIFCAQILLLKGISGQYAGIPGGLAAEEFALANGLPYGAGSYVAPIGYGNGFGAPSCPPSVAPSSGGGFAVTSTSPISPTGITVVSENAIEGSLAIVGELPFLGAVALEGNLPTSGAGGINYGCGNGAVGIISEGIAPPAPAYGAGYGPAGLSGGPYGPGYPAYGPRGY